MTLDETGMKPPRDDTDEPDLPGPDKPSKSQRKREALALQALGERLVDLEPVVVESLPLDAALREAIRDARTITRRGARRRQFQLIGKLMRRADPESIRALRARLEAD